MALKKYIALASVCLTAIIFGCHEEKVVPITGDIIGFVQLFDEDGGDLTLKSDVKVMLGQNHLAMTNGSGRFEFNNIQPGTLKFGFEKEGYSNYTLRNFIFAGGNVPAVVSNIRLIQTPQIEILTHSVTSSDTRVTISGTMTEVNRYYFIYYFSKDPQVSNDTFESSHGYSFCCGLLDSFQHELGIPSTISGPVYMAVYAMSFGNQQGSFNYYDPEKEKWVNPAVKKLIDAVKVR